MGWKERTVQMCYHLIMFLVLAVYLWNGFFFFLSLRKEPFADAGKQGQVFVLKLLSYFTGALILLSFPFTFLNVVGLVFLNPFSEPSKHKIGDNVPFICFRVVTKGMYPKLVKDTTFMNMEVCRRVGLKNCKFEIVTDKSVSVGKHQDIRETVVPDNYQTKNNALYKARALQWSLEPNVNILSNDDWIVHLDEETKLTDDVIYGIVDFIDKSSADIGQGVIVYADDVIENWLTTLADGLRVAFDYGVMRFGLQVLKRPIFGFKGSFIIAKVKAEMDVGFDYGPKESIAEDLRFALTAWTKGYKFDFVQGVMVEKSTFSFMDFIKQRKRWYTGHFHVLWGNSLPLYCKSVLLPLNVVNSFLWIQVLNTIIAPFYSIIVLDDFLPVIGIIIPTVLFSYMFGNFMSFRRRRFGMIPRICIVVLSQLLMPLAGLLEAIATVWGFLGRNSISFHIVEKRISFPVNESVEDLEEV